MVECWILQIIQISERTSSVEETMRPFSEVSGKLSEHKLHSKQGYYFLKRRWSCEKLVDLASGFVCTSQQFQPPQVERLLFLNLKWYRLGYKQQNSKSEVNPTGTCKTIVLIINLTLKS
jgi:hypothetical protein